MRGDGRSRRVAVVPDSYLNPAPDASDRLAELAEAGWGVVALPQPGLEPEVEAAVLAGIADQLAAFLDDGYEVALAEPSDPTARRLAELLAADGREIRESVAP
ncbi:MAG TPA: hypothetical protein VJN72_04605 [Gaiellales bacterium]|nr:hypothetical protein [Gaiellales bacterium]